ncbi:MAG: hypothetical protein K2H98_08130 [Duncaniella sp.]|nr:hypothetical protein [Duncaniella sp.]
MSENVAPPSATEEITAPAVNEEPPQGEPAVPLGTFELLRNPGSDTEAVDTPDDDVTASVLSRPRRSVWD